MFAVLAFMAIKTLPDIRIRVVTLLILGMFAVKTWVGYKRDQLQQQDESDRS